MVISVYAKVFSEQFRLRGTYLTMLTAYQVETIRRYHVQPVT